MHTIDGMYTPCAQNPLFDYLQRRGRERHNRDATAIERDDVRGMLKTLRNGGTIWYAPDQDYGPKQSIFLPLFGIQAATVTATSSLHRLNGHVDAPRSGVCRAVRATICRSTRHCRTFRVTAKRLTACASTSGSSRWCAPAPSSTCGRIGASNRPAGEARLYTKQRR